MSERVRHRTGAELIHEYWQKQAKKTQSDCERCGLCCKYLKVTIESLTTDERRYLETRNKCYLRGNSLIILVTCKHLKRKNSKYICDVHNTAAYPTACKKGACLRKTDKEEAEFIEGILKERGK